MDLNKKYLRYHRQIILKEFGELGQQKLLDAKVLVIGAGGLGCPALQYLTAAGIGNIGIVDDDVVELSNLQRQILFAGEDIGSSKSEIAAKKLGALNSEIHMKAFNLKITNTNALDIIKDYDIVIDGSDNFPTRYLINDACVLLNKPLVYGSVLRFEGQVGVFNLKDRDTNIKTNYRDLFSEMSNSDFSLSCSEVGVLGVLPGLIGIMQATEAIKIITSIGKPLVNKILTYNALNNTFYDMEVSPANLTDINYPKSKEAFLSYNYELNCAAKNTGNEIGVGEFELMREDQHTVVIDVRETGELPLVAEFEHIHIPLENLKDELRNISVKGKVLVFCNSGMRSLRAVSIIRNTFPNLEIYSLADGIIQWKKDKEILSK